MSSSGLTQLARSRGGMALLGALALTAGICAFLPLASHLGFELALVLTVVGALVAPAAGMASLRLSPERPLRAALRGMAFSLGALLLPVALIGLNSLRKPSCDPWSGLGWLVLLPVPTLLLASALGTLTRALSSSTRGAILKLVGLFLLSLLPGLWLIWAGPGFYLFDHFFGYFPGPLYDEVVVLSSQVFAWRGLTLGWLVAVLLGCAALGSQWRGLRVGALLFALALLLVEIFFGTRLGLRTSDASLADALGGVHRIDDLEIHHPREWSREQRDTFALDAAFRASQVKEALQLEAGPPVRIWMYRSVEEKRRLTGAGHTSFAKPWRREIHIHSSGFPHPVLRHELVHAYAGSLGAPPFGAPGGLIPNSPLIEGFAVAFDTDTDTLTLAQRAKAMRELELAPDVSVLFSPAGFLTSAPSRAYAHAGAFLRFLDETLGRKPLLMLYRHGRLDALGDPEKLVEDFGRWLDAVEVGELERAEAHRQFSRPSVFRRHCAREVSALTDRARELQRQGLLEESLAAWESACRMEPDDPGLLRAPLSMAIELGEPERIESLTTRIFSHPKLHDSLRAAVLLELGDAAWKADELSAAQEHFRRAAALSIDAATQRSALAKMQAVSSPETALLLRPLLASGDAGLDSLFALDEHLRAHPDDALVAYLLGRQFVQRDSRTRGIALLERASGALGHPSLERENARLLIRAKAETGDCEGTLRLKQRPHLSASDRALAEDWAARCRFLAERR